MKRLIIIFFQFAVLAAYGQTIDPFLTPLERGQFQGDRRVGVWEYYDWPNVIGLKVDYTEGKLLDYRKDTTSYFYLKEGKWIKSRLDIPCRFHGSWQRLFEHYYKIDFPYKDEKKKVRWPILTFEVDESGRAVNPEVVGDNWNKQINKKLIETFNSAPNSWIVGITPAGDAVRCRMAITVHLCDKDCKKDDGPSVEAHFIIGGTKHHVPTDDLDFGLTIEGRGMEFSPDDKKILWELGMPSILSFANLETGQAGWVPYTNTKGATWLDNERLLFKYQYSHWPSVAATFNTKTEKIETHSDSVTYFHIVSPKERELVLATDGRDISIWKMSLDKPGSTVIYRNRQSLSIPVAWSPDHTTLVVSEHDNTFIKFVLVEVATGRKKTIPLFNCRFLGFSLDGKKIILSKVAVSAYSSATNFYSYDVETNEVDIFFSLKNISEALLDPMHERMCVRIVDKVYLVNFDKPEEKELLFEDSGRLCWSNNGNLLAYFHTKGNQLHVFDVTTRRSRKVTDIQITAK